MMDKRVSAEKPFFLFGMGNRRKLIYRAGKLTAFPDGEVLLDTVALTECIEPAEYRVRWTTAEGEYTVCEDERAVTLTRADGTTAVLAASPLCLPDFTWHPYRDALRILHHEIVINIVDGRPVPNFFVYRKPWYRDGAMMAMVLERTGNLSLITDWVASLEDLYDRNNAGIEESDNLGQLLYLLAVTKVDRPDLVNRILCEAQRRTVDGALTGLSDFSAHPVYQTKWLKFGLESLGIDHSAWRVPDVADSYAGLFWMDGHRTKEPVVFDADYPYLTWAKAHTAAFPMETAELRRPLYPLSLEANASEADYTALLPYFPALAQARCAAPHTWHAAEMFLYLIDNKEE